MATIKSFTDIEQSKVLANILPLESADMYYFDDNEEPNFKVRNGITYYYDSEDFLCCWSLAALLGGLPKIINNETLFIETSAALWHIGYRNIYTARAGNLVDACYELILKLKELKML